MRRLTALLAIVPMALTLSAAQVPPGEPEFSPERIRADVAYLADDKLEGRFTAGAGYFNAAAYVANRFAKLGMKGGGDIKDWFQLVPITIGTAQYRSPNVIGVIPGSDPKLKDEYVVMSAHLDHLGSDPKQGKDKIFNGAMDNASGVSTMLEAAHAFATSGKPPRRSILFIALTGEELGLLGSDYFARHPTIKGKIVADVNLDMPILLYDFQDVVAFGAEHSTLGPIVAAAGARMGVTLSPDPMPAENLFVRSDHYSFVKAGVPSVFLVTGFKNGGQKAFKDFERLHYHQVSDDLSQAFDWKVAAKFAKLNYLIAREIADRDEAPLWYAGNQYGDRYAKGAPRAPRP